MIIAVSYDNGRIFQHFGKTEKFEYFTADEDGRLTDSVIKSNDGQGHGALAGILKENKTDILICGGIGEGALDALAQAGIEVYAGNSGPVEAAVVAYLSGQLLKKAVKCDHHDHGEGHSCGEHSCK